MNDPAKTNQELLEENAVLKQRIQELEKSEAERKRAEEILQISETRYRRLFESAQDGILILDADTEQVMDANPFMQGLLGYSCEEFVGKKLWDIGSFKDITASKISFAELQRKGYIRYEDLPLETSDGRHINVEFVSNVYLVDSKRIIQCNIRDITDRKRAEAALRESEERYRSVFENHAAVKLLIDPDTGRIIAANEAAVDYYGWSHDRLKQMNIQEINIISTEDVKKEMAKARTKKRIHFEFRHRRANGSIRDVEVFSSKIEVKGKDLLHSIINDITDRKQAEEDRSKLILELREALSQVKTLRGLLPICASCKKIRDDKGYWNQIEAYIEERSDVEFTHGICQECKKKLYPALYK